jgi:hypothetical protein
MQRQAAAQAKESIASLFLRAKRRAQVEAMIARLKGGHGLCLWKRLIAERPKSPAAVFEYSAEYCFREAAPGGKSALAGPRQGMDEQKHRCELEILFG